MNPVEQRNYLDCSHLLQKKFIEMNDTVIDELMQRYIRYWLLKYLIMMFSNMEKIKKGAQLIFTSHDLSTME